MVRGGATKRAGALCALFEIKTARFKCFWLDPGTGTEGRYHSGTVTTTFSKTKCVYCLTYDDKTVEYWSLEELLEYAHTRDFEWIDRPYWWTMLETAEFNKISSHETSPRA